MYRYEYAKFSNIDSLTSFLNRIGVEPKNVISVINKEYTDTGNEYYELVYCKEYIEGV